MSLQQVDHHLSSNQHLLDKIQSTQDTILEFDILTGDTKTWAWPKPEGEEHIPVFRLAEYRATHLLKFPCCLCARLLDIVTESAVYIAATGEYRGFWVASCAKDMCGYFVPLQRFGLQGDLLEKDYPSRTPPPVLHVRESITISHYAPRRSDTMGFLDVRSAYPIIAMPRYEPPADVEESVNDMILRLDSWPRPGIPLEQFLEIYAVCACGMASTRRMFHSHECIKRV